VQAKLAWRSNAAPAVGGFLARAYSHNGMTEKAEMTYREAYARTQTYDKQDRMGLAELRTFLDNASKSSKNHRIEANATIH
jgi:hypothetical protein